MAKKGDKITPLFNQILDSIDEETGENNATLLARQLMDIATGKKGGTRESLQAAQIILERVEGKTKAHSSSDPFSGIPKYNPTLAEKYKEDDSAEE